MKLLDAINLWIKKMRHKRTFSLLRNDNLLWRANLSPAMIVTIGVAVVTIIMGILLVLVAYTPLLDIMPGYRTNAVRSREMLIQSVARVDSLERRLNQMLTTRIEYWWWGVKRQLCTLRRTIRCNVLRSMLHHRRPIRFCVTKWRMTKGIA